MGKCNVTKVNDCGIYLIETEVEEKGQNCVLVRAYDEKSGEIELIGCAFPGMDYFYDSRHIVFGSEDGVEFIFDLNKFCFITNESQKRKIYSKILKSQVDMIEGLDEISETGTDTIRDLRRRYCGNE